MSSTKCRHLRARAPQSFPWGQPWELERHVDMWQRMHTMHSNSVMDLTALRAAAHYRVRWTRMSDSSKPAEPS